MQFKILSDYLDQLIAASQIPGCVLVVIKNGKVVYEEEKGLANLGSGCSMQMDSIVRTFSMSKLFTATALMMLHDEGWLGLDDPVCTYLPEFYTIQVHHTTEKGESRLMSPQRQITVRDLMLHRSGIGYIFTLEGTPLYEVYEKAALFDPQRSTAEMIDLLASLPLAFHPGSAELYGHSYDVLGRLIEVISGQTLEEFLQCRLFQPLGMSDTSFLVPPPRSERLSDLCTYSLARKLVVVDRGSESRCVGPARLQLGGTGVLATAQDCLLFFQMLLAHGLHDGQQVVSRSVVDLLIRHCLPQRSIPGEGIGSGIVSSSSPHGNAPPAGKFPSFFSRGAAGTIAWVDPSKQLIAVFLTQLIPPLMVTRYYPYLGTERLGPELGCVHPGMFDFIPEIEQRIHRALQE